MRRYLFILHMAKRYLFAKKSHNIIHVITLLSGFAILVVSGALIIILSAFNGLEFKVMESLNLLDPPILASPSKSKFLVLNDSTENKLRNLASLEFLATTIEETALLAYGNQQMVGTVRGIDDHYLSLFPMKNHLVEGYANLYENGNPRAIMSEELARKLGIAIHNPYQKLTLYAPKPGKKNLNNPFNEVSLRIGGIVFLPHEANKSLLLIPKSLAEKLTGKEKAISNIQFSVANNHSIPSCKKEIAQLLGTDWTIKDRLEQHEAISKIMRGERWMVILIVAFILLIASFNLVSVQTLLIFEKKKDLGTLWSLGLDWADLKKIFIAHGALVAFLGGFFGILAGTTIVFLQKWSGIYKWNVFTGEAYPVIILPSDLAISFALVLGMGWLVSFWRMKILPRSAFRSAQLLK